MATNNSPGPSNQTIPNDIELHIRDEVLGLSQRRLVAYQFGQPMLLPKQSGVIATATRYERLPLPSAPLSEGVAAAGASITIAQVSVTVQQWGDLVRVTDVADMTIKHPLFKQAIRLISIQQVETLERNTLNTLLGGAQVNYAASRANRASLIVSDVLNPLEIGKVVGALRTFGAIEYMGDERTDMKVDAGKPSKASSDPKGMPHYVAMIHPLVEQDLMQNSTVATAFSQSDVNKLYNGELGVWGGVRFCRATMIPFWVGVATVGAGTPSTTGGALANGTYYLQVTASPISTSVEQRIYQVATVTTVGGSGAGSISLTLPTQPGYFFNVYIGTTTSPANLATTASGPTVGQYAGQAAQLTSGSTVILTGVGIAQTPPAAPATGVSVYPTIFFGQDAYAQVILDNVKYTYLNTADKSDVMNQLRITSWKMMYGSLILHNCFMVRVESSSAFSPGYTAGTSSD